MAELQVFLHPKSKAAKAASRFFKERNITFHALDLTRRPMSKGELSRFIQKYGIHGILDEDSKVYKDNGWAYLSTSEDGWIERIIHEPQALLLPLVRYGNVLVVGQDPAGWQEIVDEIKRK